MKFTSKYPKIHVHAFCPLCTVFLSKFVSYSNSTYAGFPKAIVLITKLCFDINKIYCVTVRQCSHKLSQIHKF